MSRPLALTTLSTVVFLVAVEGRPAQERAVPAERVRHSLEVALDPARGWLTVTDTLSLPADSSGPDGSKPLGMTEFLLHAGLKVTASEPAVTEVPVGDPRDVPPSSGRIRPRRAGQPRSCGSPRKISSI